LKNYLPDGLAWLVRYHSIVPETCEAYMDARDREYRERYLRPFSRYDHETKTPIHLPQRRLQDYRHIVERALPATIVVGGPERRSSRRPTRKAFQSCVSFDSSTSASAASEASSTLPRLSIAECTFICSGKSTPCLRITVMPSRFASTP